MHDLRDGDYNMKNYFNLEIVMTMSKIITCSWLVVNWMFRGYSKLSGESHMQIVQGALSLTTHSET